MRAAPALALPLLLLASGMATAGTVPVSWCFSTTGGPLCVGSSPYVPSPTAFAAGYAVKLPRYLPDCAEEPARGANQGSQPAAAQDAGRAAAEGCSGHELPPL